MRTRFALAMAVLFLVSAVAIAADSSWTGYIADSKCGAKAAHEGARECTVKCVQEGAKYVFVNDADKKVYAVADQEKVADHAGHHVTVTGSLEGDTMKVTSVEMAKAK